MKILHVYKDYDPPVRGGIEGHVARLCRYQQQWASVEVLVSSQSRHTRKRIHEGIPITDVGTMGRFLQTPLSPALPWHLYRSDADVIVLHLPNPTAEIGWLLARSRAALVVRYHSDVVRQASAMKVYGPIQHRLLQKAALILPTSTPYLETSPVLARHKERCRVVPLGIETEAFAAAAPEDVAELHARYGSPFVLFSGKHRYYKGLSVLVDAATSIGAPVVIAGDGPERAALMAQAQAKGVTIHFPGPLSHEELVAHLHGAAVFAFPSVARSEAFGISIMEAHACGCPVVATRLGTGVEFINEDGKTGFNVPPGDGQALADAINTLLDDEGLRQRMGDYARQRVKTDFHIAKIAEQEWQCYREVAPC